MFTLISVSTIATPSSNQLNHNLNHHNHRQRVKMVARQLDERPQNWLLAVAVIIVCIIIQVQSVASSSIGANGTAQSTAVASLPTLSERAANLNSRYLSAGSTASLAAATVAAAANQQANGGSSGGNSQPSHQHQHSQQQQQQQQQQLATASGHQQQQQQHSQPPTQTSAIQQQVSSATNSAVQYNSVAQQQQQQPIQVQAAANQPPVMASTYTYNPTTGQYSSSPDLAQPQANQFQLPAPQVVVSNPAQFGPLPVQQTNFIAPAYQTHQRQPNQRPPLSYPFGFAAVQQQHPSSSRYHQAVYTRRNGLVARPQTGQNYLNGNGAGLDDDGSGSGFSLQQQQQQTGGISLADQLAASLGLNLDPSYSLTGSGLPSPSNVYLQQQQNANHHHHNQNPIVDFLSQPTSSGHLNAFNGLPYLSQSNSNQHHLFASGGGPTSGASISTGQLSSSATNGGGGGTSDQQCLAADGRHGTCYQASECIKRGGTPMGRCGGPLDLGAGQSLGGGGGGSPSSSVCCLFDVTCGQFAAERFVYFRNPGYPANSYDQSRMCRAKIGKLDKGVCQIRLDMLRFDIAKPTNGNCSQDMFVVSGQNENYVIPKICGFNDGQHYYVGVDESGVITLHMMMMGYYRRSFEILITQIPCRSDFGAPAHCLQYFIGTHGTIKSFNYDADLDSSSSLANNNNQQQQQAFVNYDLQQDGSSLMSLGGGGGGGLQNNGNGLGPTATAPYGLQILQRQQQQMFTLPQLQGQNRFGSLNDLTGPAGGQFQFGGYPNDLDYTICIRKESGFCSISYQLSRSTDQQAGGGGGSLAPFAVGQSPSWPAGHTNETGSISTDCRDDYLLIGGVRLCSGQSSLWSSNSYDPTSYQGVVQAQFNASAATGNSYQSLLQQQQQLQNQQNLLMQQLARLQQQQQTGGNVSSLSGNNQLLFGTTGQATGNNNNNLDQQQAALVQQLMLVQQHLGNLAAATSQQQQQQQQQQFTGFQSDLGPNPNELQGSIITDTTSGPFLLRFVSNNARNARGFHIDYRQNPCK